MQHSADHGCPEHHPSRIAEAHATSMLANEHYPQLKRQRDQFSEGKEEPSAKRRKARSAEYPRKRQRDQFSEGKEEPSAKRRKARSTECPPQFWDGLSRITLTRKALKEFDRRIKESKPSRIAKVAWTIPRLLRSDTRRLELLASSSSLDLSRLRGYAELPEAATMSQTRSRTGKRDRDSGQPGGGSTTKTTTTGPYNAQFEQLLIDNGVYPDGHRTASGSRPPKPQNMEDIRRRLSQPRPSLSPSRFSDGDFEDFRDSNRAAASELMVMQKVIPTITGNTDRQYYHAGNRDFNNLAEFAPNISVAKPDGYDGARPSEILPRVRADLNGYIVPSTATQLPAAPNNFMEVKGQSGRTDVLQRQAMYAGAVGARGMLQLQNYGSETPGYDGNAYTTVSAYHAGNGTLQMYATHPKQSATGQAEYYMTQLDSYAMTGNVHNFRQGAAALRNARDFSKEQRDRFIANANATAQNLPVVATPSSGTGSRTAALSRSDGGPFESDTSMDELAPEYEESAKRQCRRVSEMPQTATEDSNPRSQPRRSSNSTASTSVEMPLPAGPPGALVWQGYSIKLLHNGTYELECTIRGRTTTMTACWSEGQKCPQVFDEREKRWLQTSFDGELLRFFTQDRSVTLGK